MHDDNKLRDVKILDWSYKASCTAYFDVGFNLRIKMESTPFCLDDGGGAPVELNVVELCNSPLEVEMTVYGLLDFCYFFLHDCP